MSFPYGAPDPGWYPDPRISGVERHWDGLAWTEHTRPAAAPPGTLPWPGAAPAAPDHGPSSALHWLLPVGRSWQSVVAPYAAIVAMVIALAGVLAALGFAFST